MIVLCYSLANSCFETISLSIAPPANVFAKLAELLELENFLSKSF